MNGSEAGPAPDTEAPVGSDAAVEGRPENIVAGSPEHVVEAAPEHVNVAAFLGDLARSQPDALAVAVSDGRNLDGTARYAELTALELHRRSDRIAHALVSVGIGSGVRTALMVKPGLDFFSLTFAMLKVGAVPVMVDPGMGTKNLGKCLGEAEPEAFIGIPKAQAARAVLGWAKQTVRTNVTVGHRLLWGGHTLSKLEARASSDPFPILEPDPEQTAAILFTSGSTGVPKGVVTPFRVFAAQVKALREVYGIQPGERDLATFPLFALFGPALGMASVIPEMDASRPAEADPRRLFEAFQDYSCTNLFASPALIDKLGHHCVDQGLKLESLRRAISAGAPASNTALDRFQQCLPDGVEVLNSYGATESLPVSFLGSRTILRDTWQLTDNGGGVCVGPPTPGMDVRIVPIHDQPIETWDEDLALPQGEIGEIVVRGDVVTPSYYQRPQETKLAKIHTEHGDVWHRMGDVGYFDEQGRLWMCGRKGHRVEVETGTMYTIPCEAVFNTHPAVRRSALVGVVREGRTTMPVLCVERVQEATIENGRLTGELLEMARSHEHTRPIDTILYHPSFPVDVRHNTKIFREKLALWADKELASRKRDSSPDSPPSDPPDEQGDEQR
jgi:acyl-CoA synthetase (AMP-forming)/AMP-acid ligase II